MTTRSRTEAGHRRLVSLSQELGGPRYLVSCLRTGLQDPGTEGPQQTQGTSGTDGVSIDRRWTHQDLHVGDQDHSRDTMGPAAIG